MSKVINTKVGDNITSLAMANDGVKLLLQTYIDALELEGNYRLVGTYTLEKIEVEEK